MLAVSVFLANSDGSPEFQRHMINNAASFGTVGSTHFTLPEVKEIFPPIRTCSLLPQCDCHSLRPPSCLSFYIITIIFIIT